MRRYDSERVDALLEVAEKALDEAGRQIAAAGEDLRARIGQVAHYKGMLAARDGHEVILTFDRIGPDGVPTYFEDGTILACTDSDRRWRLVSHVWVPVTL